MTLPPVQIEGVAVVVYILVLGRKIVEVNDTSRYVVPHLIDGKIGFDHERLSGISRGSNAISKERYVYLVARSA